MAVADSANLEHHAPVFLTQLLLEDFADPADLRFASISIFIQRPIQGPQNPGPPQLPFGKGDGQVKKKGEVVKQRPEVPAKNSQITGFQSHLALKAQKLIGDRLHQKVYGFASLRLFRHRHHGFTIQGIGYIGF